jgi:hypothetical protein
MHALIEVGLLDQHRPFNLMPSSVPVRESAVEHAHHFLLATHGTQAKSILMHVFKASKASDVAVRAACHRLLQRIHLT